MARSILFSHYTALEICSGLADRAMHDVTKACSFREALDMGAVRGQVRGVGLARIRHAPADSVSLSCVRELAVEVSSVMSSRCLSYPVHITTSSSAQCRRKNDVAVIHQHMLALPRRSVFRVSDTSLVCTPEFAFVEIAGQGGSMIELLELGYEMCGTYRARLSCEPKGRTPVLPERVATAVIPDGGGRSPAHAVDVVSTGRLRAEVANPRFSAVVKYDAMPLATVSSIRDFVTKNPSLRGSYRVRRILPYLTGGSASARETKLALLLGLPRRFGGYGLGMPELNYEVMLSDGARAAARRSFVRCDLCWPDSKIDVEYQSRFAHEGEKARIRDSRRANALASMGWTTIAVTNEELSGVRSRDAVAKAVRLALGVKSCRMTDDFIGAALRARFTLLMIDVVARGVFSDDSSRRRAPSSRRRRCFWRAPRRAYALGLGRLDSVLSATCIITKLARVMRRCRAPFPPGFLHLGDTGCAVFGAPAYPFLLFLDTFS